MRPTAVVAGRGGAAALVALLAGSLGAAGLSAQEVRGRVVDSESGAAVVGAMVLALGTTGGIHARALSDERGDFVLTIPPVSPVETYQVVRIGYASQDFPAPALSAGEARVLRIATAPIEVEGIGVVAENLCGAELAGSRQVYDIWLETRKALEMTRLTQSQQSLTFDTEIVARALEPGSLRERERRAEPRRLRGQTPYYSLTGDQMTRGWVAVDDDGSILYWAPDASALLSDEFEDQHCFGAELGSGQIVLRFAPNRTRGDVPEIRGEIFLNRATYRLERLRYDYTSVPLPREAQGHASGEVHFFAAPNGSWVVTRWWIRMPIVSARWEQDTFRSIQRAEVVELREEGGRLLRIRSGSEVIEVPSGPP